jgi:quercetin dioxygenase-like cupin family protein
MFCAAWVRVPDPPGASVWTMTPEDPAAVEGAVDLLSRSGIGPLWGLASTDLNATLLAWPSGHGVAEHVNAELDVLVVVLDGRGSAVIDGESHRLVAGSALLIPRGARRAITADDTGVRYLSVHRRRGPLQIQPSADR